MTPTRPMARWFGGKWQAAPFVLAHVPPHRCYVEAFGGAASILLRKPRSSVEVLNDLDDQVFALYSVVRDPVLAERLRFLCEHTPFSRRELELAFQQCDPNDRIEVARRLIVRGALAYGTGVLRMNKALHTGLRDHTGVTRSVPAHDWANYPESLARVTARLRGVIVDNRDAIKVMTRHDGVDTLHYVDPPYVRETRKSHRHGYAHELDSAGQDRLLTCLRGLRGMVVLSGYAHPTYAEALAGWRRVDKDLVDQGKHLRTETLWLSPSCDRAQGVQAEFFDIFDVREGAVREKQA